MISLQLLVQEWFIYRATNRIPEAIDVTLKLIELGEDSDESLTVLKDLYMKNDDRQSAIGVYDQLIERHPDDKSLMDDRQALIRSLGATSEELIAELLKSHEKFPDDPSYILRNRIQYQLREWLT